MAVLVSLATPTDAEAANRKPVRQLLDSLPVSASAVEGYTRELFRHWTSTGGCSTRALVLIDERTAGDVRGCTVVGGRWTSLYDGVQVGSARALDIDHMVPLKEAWESGAWRWTPATRTAFANDLGYASSLIAVTASTNRSKGDRDPAEWLPAARRCDYARAWIGVKYRWDLSVDPAEKSALLRLINGCPKTMVVPPLAGRATDPAAGQPPAATPGTAQPPVESSDTSIDPRFPTCGEANAAGFGPYTRGDAEYDWYIDRDRDGVACER